MNLKDLAKSFVNSAAGKKNSSIATNMPLNMPRTMFKELSGVEPSNHPSGDFSLNTGDSVQFEGDDLNSLSKLFREIKLIQKQEVLLIGERLSIARGIFQKYEQSDFRGWLANVLGSFKTGYNYLAFHDLYIALPDSLKDCFQKIPSKAAYILASNKKSLDWKINFIKNHYQETSKQIIDEIKGSTENNSTRSDLDKSKKILKSIDSLCIEWNSMDFRVRSEMELKLKEILEKFSFKNM